jgi:protein MpaA
MKPQGLNKGGYAGETIDIPRVLADIRQMAESSKWEIQELPGGQNRPLLTLHRAVSKPSKRVYISTGIHGDEPAGPPAVQQLIRDNAWPSSFELWICPCLNPTGFPANRRENAEGADLNRDYRHLRSSEIRAHVAWLEKLPEFDLSLCLHEDWEAKGFYVYELNPEQRPSLAEPMVNAVAKVCPIDHSPVIEGRDAHCGIIRPNLDPNSRPEWPESFYLIQNKTRLSYTIEAPSDFYLPMRVAALVTATRTALAAL